MQKIKDFIKEEYKFLITCLLIILISFIRLPYNIYTGGGLIDLTNRLNIENEYKETGSFNLSYVSETRATIPTYLISLIMGYDSENINKNKIDENDNPEYLWQREKLYLENAIDSAIISACNEANEEIVINKEVLKVLYLDKLAETNLKIGDTILKANDEDIYEYNDLVEICSKLNIDDEVKFKVLRDNEEIECYAKIIMLNDAKKVGIYLIKLYDYETERNIDINFKESEGGSSGGFMLSLAIYNRIIEEDLTKGRIIAGTGTIDANGNIGEIAGIKYKLSGANAGNASIFFVPEANYEEAMKVKEEKEYKIDVVMVKTLNDAIEYLRK